MKIFIILSSISFVGWIILYIIYKQMEPDNDRALFFRLWHLILVLISIFIPVLNISVFAVFGALFCLILSDYYHFKDNTFCLKLSKFLNKRI